MLWLFDQKEKSGKESFDWLTGRRLAVKNFFDWLTRRRSAVKNDLIGWPRGDRRMRGMCGKEEEENRARFNPLERQQRRKKNSEKPIDKNLIRASLILHLLYAYICIPRFHQSSYSNYRFFYTISIPFRFLFNIWLGLGWEDYHVVIKLILG